MLTIEDGAISLTRGDTAYLNIAIQNDDGSDYEFQEGDTLTLSVRKDYEEDTPYLFQKKVDGGQTIIIYPEDTKDKEYGSYYYDVQLNTYLGEVFTVVGPYRFKLTKEVTLS